MARKVLVTGGAGFIGCNLVRSLLAGGHDVTVFDGLARRGSEKNLAWLFDHQGTGKLHFAHADIRDFSAMSYAARDADVIYHLAAQVAVTSSVADPRGDFEINALGTFNVLEAARLGGRQPIVLMTSTNKVYGGLEDVVLIERDTRYEYRDFEYGIPESQPLDFHSPYGCSKGSADQYVRDYTRIYDLRTVVFRMSCIFGPRQFGTEDQGWLAHLMISALLGRPITIYGNGKQVRDILFVDDLVRAFQLATERIDDVAGQVYNIGGGPSNSVSIWREFGEILRDLTGRRVDVAFSDWRPGDQFCYVSDIRKAEKDLGWRPQVDRETGIQRLWDWLVGNERLVRALVEA